MPGLKGQGPNWVMKSQKKKIIVAPIGGIYAEFDMEDFYKNLSGNQVGLKSSRNIGGFTYRFRNPSLSPGTFNRHKSAVFERNDIRLLA